MVGTKSTFNFFLVIIKTLSLNEIHAWSIYLKICPKNERFKNTSLVLRRLVKKHVAMKYLADSYELSFG